MGDIDPMAIELHRDTIVIDGLIISKWDRQIFEDMHHGGLTAANCTCAVWEGFTETMDNIANWKRLMTENDDILLQVYDVDDIRRAKEENRVGIILGWQNTYPIESNLDRLRLFSDLGVRFMQLTYNNQTPLAGGCFEPKDSGVSRFGYAVIEEMNRLDMIVDLSHAGKQTCMDAIHLSSKPIAISHANPSFFHKALRNIDNDVLIELAKKNGFIGLSLYPYHLKNLGKCTIEDYCSMVKQLINLIGIEHIGIGSDLCKNWPDEVVMWMRNGRWTKKIDYGESTSKSTAWPEQPSWFTKASDLKNIFESLVINGLTDDQAFKIIGTNWFEFMKNHF